MKSLVLILFISSFTLTTIAQYSTIVFKEITINAKYLTADQTGNVYVVRKNNELVRFNGKGDSTATYQNSSNGDLRQVEVSNPLKPLLFYPAFSKLVMLDRMLSVKNEINLHDAQIQNATVVAQSIQNRIWIYDAYQTKLKLLDEQINVVMQTGDLRQELQTTPNISCIVEADWKVLLCDSLKGIFVFDFAGNYINTISIFAKSIRTIGAQIQYIQNDTLFSWDKFKLNQPLLALPKRKEKIIDAIINENRLLVLYDKKLILYDILMVK